MDYKRRIREIEQVYDVRPTEPRPSWHHPIARRQWNRKARRMTLVVNYVASLDWVWES
jgi:hypothetical protein